MKIVYKYLHLGGSEILQVRYLRLLKEIKDCIAEVRATRSKTS